MMFPLYVKDLFGYFPGLLLGTLIGMGFGFALERGGFGSARILTAQFYMTNMRVLKVMFSAVATAALGMALLGGAGLLDLSAITVPETFLGPQLVGGLIFGVGFIVSGYCPGTGVVAMASGNIDALVTMVGMLIGSLLFGIGYGPLEKFYKSGAMGVVTLPGALGVPPAVVAAGVAAMAVGCFLGAEKLEVVFSRKAGENPPVSNPRTRNRVFAGFATAAILAFAVLALPKVAPGIPEKPYARMGAAELAKTVITAPESLWLVDVRGEAAPVKDRIPGATALPAGAQGDEWLASLAPTRTLVVYGEKELEALPAGAKRFTGEIAVLSGGYDAFRSAFLTAPASPAEATPVLVAEYRMKSALYQHFTGVRSAPEPVKVETRAVAGAPAAPKKGGGC